MLMCKGLGGVMVRVLAFHLLGQWFESQPMCFMLESYLPMLGGLQYRIRGHGGRVVTLSPPTSEAGVRSPARAQVGKLVVACRWSAVYSTEP